MLESTVATPRIMVSKTKADIDQSWEEIKKTRENLDEDGLKQLREPELLSIMWLKRLVRIRGVLVYNFIKISRYVILRK